MTLKLINFINMPYNISGDQLPILKTTCNIIIFSIVIIHVAHILAVN
uniref:Uncharacterized protein n=1 Tax=Rhizophora mucronata TaxID=61149 RepID=A0A2P2R4M9_RHIMU